MKTIKKHNHPDAKLPEDLPGPGSMTEYGWWDPDIEDAVRTIQSQYGLNRNDAIVRLFNTI